MNIVILNKQKYFFYINIDNKAVKLFYHVFVS